MMEKYHFYILLFLICFNHFGIAITTNGYGISCPPGETRCDNGVCISSDWFCDHVCMDCLDGSDEIRCCPSGKFNCANGKCVERSRLCDGTNDCRDNSDEENCPVTAPATANIAHATANMTEAATSLPEITSDKYYAEAALTTLPAMTTDKYYTEAVTTPVTANIAQATTNMTEAATTLPVMTTDKFYTEATALPANSAMTTDKFYTEEVTMVMLLTDVGIEYTTIKIEDNEPPILKCPTVGEHFAVTDELAVEVSWSEPIYMDKSDNIGGINSTHISPSVFSIGQHNITYLAWDPSANIAGCSFTIIITAACPANSTTVNSRVLFWPLTPAYNQFVPSEERCDVRTTKRGEGVAVRVCMRDYIRGAIWTDPMYIGCGGEDEYDLQDLSQTTVTTNNVDNVAEALSNATLVLLDQRELTPENLQFIAQVFSNIVNVESVTSEVTASLISVLNNLADLSKAENIELDMMDYVEILLAIEEQLEMLISSRQNLTVAESNIALVITTIMPNHLSDFSFVVLSSDDNDFHADDLHIYSYPEVIIKDRRISISLPSSIFNRTGNGTIGAGFVVYNSDVLFPFNFTNQTVGSDIVSAIVVADDETITELSDYVALEFNVFGENPQCVFWDFEIPGWSPKGCKLDNGSIQVENQVTCCCDHLTNFAVLVDASYTSSHIILDYLSKIGCGISMFYLLITIIIFIKFRRLRIGPMKAPRQILLNLCVSLFFLYLVFLVGIDQVSYRYGCIVVAAVLQYLTLASVMWMGVEAFSLYIHVVRASHVSPRRFVFKAALVAWGVPLVVTAVSVAVSFGLGFNSYDHLNYCFVGTGPVLFVGIILPIATILLFNVIIFSMALFRLCRSNIGGNVQDKTISNKLRQRLKNALTMSTLIGLTWMFGFFAIEDAQFVFSLIFCVCNSFQGLVLFILFCYLQEDVRETVRPYTRRFCCEFAAQSPTTYQTASSSIGVIGSPKTQTSVGIDWSMAAHDLSTSAHIVADSNTGDKSEIQVAPDTGSDEDLSYGIKMAPREFDTDNNSPSIVNAGREETGPGAESPH